MGGLGIRRSAVIAVLAVLVFSGAHAADDKAGQYYEDALVRYNRGDMAGAAIQLRNALQQDPSMTPARLLLGKTHLQQGQAAAAEAAFRAALLQGAVRSEVVIPLTQALMDQAKYRAVVDSISAEGLPPGVRQDVMVLRANAMMELREPRQAARELDEAKAIDPRAVPVLLAQVKLALDGGDLASARSVADQALAIAPQDARAWNMKASVLHASGDVGGALDAYSRALDKDPTYSDARVGRASLLFDLRRFDEARRDLEQLKRDSPDEPRAAYLRSLWFAQEGDARGARDALNEVVKLVDPIPMDILAHRGQLLMLGGLSHYGLGNREKAKEYLEKYVALRPAEPGARKALGALYLSTGATDRAVSVLEPALKAAPNDGYLLSLLAGAYMAQKRYQTANSLLERAIQEGAGAPSVGTTLGFSLLGAGQDDLALQYLERAYSQGGQPTRAGIAVALLYMKQGRPRQAVEIAETLASREPTDATVLNLLGATRAAAGDLKGARDAYTRATAADSRFMPAHLNLARLDIAEHKYDAARARLQQILKLDSRNVQAMHELARAEQAANQPDEAIRWLEKARAVQRTNLPPALELVHLYIRVGRADKALEVAKDLELGAPDNLMVLSALGRAFQAAGDPGKAQGVYRRMARLADFDGAWQYRIAQLQLSAGNAEGARYSLEKGLSGKTDDLPSLALLTEIELQAGNLAQAEQRFREVQKRFPGGAMTHRLAGDLALARRNYPEAVQAYRNALAKEETTDNAIRLYRAHVQAGTTARGLEFIEGWRRAHPDDAVALRALAEGQLRSGDYRAARSSYEALLKRQGEDAGALNNLAVILLALDDPAALGVAERAQRRAPEDASINDTLGWVLVQQGQLDRGMRYLREAQVRDPASGEVRYHLAVALNKAGRPAEARQELEQALRNGAPFDSRDQARKLLQDLARK